MTKVVKDVIEGKISSVKNSISYNKEQMLIFRKECLKQYKFYKLFHDRVVKEKRLLEELKSEIAKG